MITPLHKKIIPYLRKIATTQSLAEAQMEAELALEVIRKATGDSK